MRKKLEAGLATCCLRLFTARWHWFKRTPHFLYIYSHNIYTLSLSAFTSCSPLSCFSFVQGKRTASPQGTRCTRRPPPPQPVGRVQATTAAGLPCPRLAARRPGNTSPANRYVHNSLASRLSWALQFFKCSINICWRAPLRSRSG